MQHDTLDHDHLSNHNWSAAEVEEINQEIRQFNEWGQKVRWARYLLIVMMTVYLIAGMVMFQSAQNLLSPEIGQRIGIVILGLAAILVLSVFLFKKAPMFSLLAGLAVYLFSILQGGVTLPGRPSISGMMLKSTLVVLFLYFLYSIFNFNAKHHKLSKRGFAPNVLGNAWRSLQSLTPITSDK